MSNRTFLLSSGRSQLSSKGYDPGEIKAAASYCVPLLWLALFDKKSLKTRKSKLEDGESAEVPYLCAKSKSAIERFRSRKASLSKLLNQHESLSADFELLITSVGGENIIVDLEELWCMDPDRVTANLTSAIEAIDENSGQVLQAAGPIIGISSLEDSQQNKPESITSHLVGYGWESPVPWENRAAFDEFMRESRLAASTDKVTFSYRKDAPPSALLIVGLFDFYQLSVGWVSPDGVWSAAPAHSQFNNWALQTKSRFKKVPRGIVFNSVEKAEDGWLISTVRGDSEDAELWQVWLKIVEGLQK